jgi:glycosyltransferase involved in cell wall biosynthesis
MKILFISSIFPNPIEPSLGCFNDSLVRALASTHDVDVLSPIPWVNLWRGLRQGIRVPLYHRIVESPRLALHYVPYFYPPKVLRQWYGKFLWVSIEGTARSLIRLRRPELVIGYWAHPDGEAAVRIGRLVGSPSCVIVGGSDVLLVTRDEHRRRRVQNVLLTTDAVIAVNEDLKNAVIGLGVPAARVHVWRQGIDVAEFRPGDRQHARQQLGVSARGRVVVWVGRMVPVKGLDILLTACSLLLSRGVEYHLYLVGDGPLRDELIAQAEALGVSASVTFVGPKLHHELADWYRAADLTVLPSRSEGLPNVLRESLACGTPFVASNVGGIDEIADPGCCLLVPPENPVALADALARALARQSEHGVPVPARFQSWEQSAEVLVQMMLGDVTDRVRASYGQQGHPAPAR